MEKSQSHKYRSIAEVISSEKEFDQIRDVAEKYEVIEKLPEIFPDLIKVAEPKKIDKGVLFLRVENSVWRSELNLKKKLLVSKINKYFNREVIKQIKFL